MTEKQKPLRQAMPWVTSIIDAWRQIPESGIDDAIRSGMQGGSDFYACENGHEIGTRREFDQGRTISLADIHIGPWHAPTAPKNAPRRK